LHQQISYLYLDQRQLLNHKFSVHLLLHLAKLHELDLPFFKASLLISTLAPFEIATISFVVMPSPLKVML